MFERIINWFKELFFGKELNAQGKIIIRRLPRTRTPRTTTVNPNAPIKYLINDPTTTDLIIEVPPPKAAPLKMKINGYVGGGHPLGSHHAQAAMCYVTLNNALNYMLANTNKEIKRWAATNTLMVLPRAGQDFNAYYDRNSLRFFFATDKTTKNVVYTCESADIVAHEFGHAYLDILRPDFWNFQAHEVWAFHEAFGDCTAILSIMQFDQVLERAIQETSGELWRSNIITRLAEEMGQAIYNLTGGKSGELPNALRDAANSFVYVEPEKLPSSSRDDELCNECHNFSRVWTGSWYEMLVKFYIQHVNEGMSQMDALKKARDIACLYLIQATMKAPATVRLFDAIAQQMLAIDMEQGGKYQRAMLDVFESRNLLRPKVKMLADVNYDQWQQENQRPCEVVEHEFGKTVLVDNKKSLKLIDHLGLTALADNPLFNVEIEVPAQASYEFNAEGKLVSANEPNEAEIVDAAYSCLAYLHENDLVGDDAFTPFEVRYGKLVRTHFVCRRCPVSNACDPNAPEYGKPWKGENNAGCGCKGRTISCDCPETTPSPPLKLGCYVSVNAGGQKSYRVGSSISRRVC